MKRSPFALAVFALLCAPSSQADDMTGVTTKLLYDGCASESEAPQGVCTAYFRGLLYGLRFGMAIQKGGYPICLPINVTAPSARRIFTKFVEDNPTVLDSDGAGAGDIMASTALHLLYSCKPAR